MNLLGRYDFLDYTSVEVDISIIRYSFNGVLSSEMKLTTDGREDIIGVLNSFSSISVVPYSTARGMVTSIDGISSDFADVELRNEADEISLNSITCGPFTINYKETIRYEVITKDSSVVFLIPRVLKTTHGGYIHGHNYEFFNGFTPIKFFLNDSKSKGILTKATKAKNIYFKQLFYPEPDFKNRRFISSSTYNFFIQGVSYVSGSRYAGIIQFIHSYIAILEPETVSFCFDDDCTTTTVIHDYDIPYPSVVISSDGDYVDGQDVIADGQDSVFNGGEYYYETNLEDSDYRFVNLSVIYTDAIYGQITVSVSSIHLEPVIFPFEFSSNLESFSDLYSGHMQIVPVVVSSSDYRIETLEPYYSVEFEQATGYIPGSSLSELTDSIMYLASFNDLEELPEFKFFTGRVIYTIQDLEDTEDYYSQEYDFYAEIEAVEHADLDDLISNRFDFEYIEKPFFRNDGMYRDMYIDVPDFVVHSAAPWIDLEHGRYKISESKYIFITNDSKLEVINVADSVLKGTISPEYKSVDFGDIQFNFPMRELAPYVMIEDNFSTDFIIMSLGAIGSTFLNIHNAEYIDKYDKKLVFNVSDSDLIEASSLSGTENIFDSRKVEVSASKISSVKYQKSAKILKETIDGLVYSQFIIDDAFNYLKKYEEYTEYYKQISYNPIVLGSIIADKTKGLLDKNAFSSCPMYTYSDDNEQSVEFYYQDIEDIENGGTSYNVVTAFRAGYVGDNHFQVSSTDKGSLLYDSNYTGYIKVCKYIKDCGTRFLTELKLPNSIYVPEGRAVSIMRTSYEIPEVSYVESLTVSIRPGENDFITNIFSVGAEVQRLTKTDDYISEKYVYLLTDRSLEDAYSREINFSLVLEINFDSIYYPGSIKFELDSLPGIYSDESGFSLSLPTETLEGLYSDFWMRLHVDMRTDIVSEYMSIAGEISVGKYVEDTYSYKTEDVIWMKMFYPVEYGTADVKSKILDFRVREEPFTTNFVIPYYYVDDIAGDILPPPEKSENNNVATKETYSDQSESGRVAYEEPEEFICDANSRKYTYLQYQGFDHMFYDGDKRLYGSFSRKDKELYMSGYITKVSQEQLSIRSKLSNLDSMKRTYNELSISHIDNLAEFDDWKFEDFELTEKELKSAGIDAASLPGVETEIKAKLNYIMDTIGLDDITPGDEVAQAAAIEYLKEVIPAMPIGDDKLETEMKVGQFIYLSNSDEEN